MSQRKLVYNIAEHKWVAVKPRQSAESIRKARTKEKLLPFQSNLKKLFYICRCKLKCSFVRKFPFGQNSIFISSSTAANSFETIFQLWSKGEKTFFDPIFFFYPKYFFSFAAFAWNVADTWKQKMFEELGTFSLSTTFVFFSRCCGLSQT